MPRDERFCKFYSRQGILSVEDEYHVLCVCSLYHELRLELLPKWLTVQPNIHKFVTLLQSRNNDILYNLAKYLYVTMQLREAALKEIHGVI